MDRQEKNVFIWSDDIGVVIIDGVVICFWCSEFC